jgi:uncharacterized protein YdiU (UPF0061 family)
MLNFITPCAPRFTTLGPNFFSQTNPSPLKTPSKLLSLNSNLLSTVGLHPVHEADTEALTQILSGNTIWQGYAPIATVYCGHQFGSFVPQLGDGRALIIAESQGQPDLYNPHGYWEIQLKGAGKTPFSRMGDGRAVLRSSIREYVCAEAMHALGIPTTRSLALTASSDPVFRENTETAAIVTRVAPSFIRFGHFEYFCYTRQPEALAKLGSFVIEHYFPDLLERPEPVWAMLEQVVQRTAELIAQWQCAGFCHGVMNTDNMSILGLTIDYGPFGFLDGFDAHHICNHSDTSGRYAYDQQPSIAHWNLYALGQALTPLLGDDIDRIKETLDTFLMQFQYAYTKKMASKLGFDSAQRDDTAFFDSTLALLHSEKIDFTRFFRGLGLLNQQASTPEQDSVVRDLFIDRTAFDAWATQWRSRLALQTISEYERKALQNSVNPNIVFRNHMAHMAIDAASQGDCAELERQLAALRTPFDDTPAHTPYVGLPPSWAAQLEVSCSS